MAKREDGFEAELKDLHYEVHILTGRRADLVQALDRLGPDSPHYERQRLQEQVGACDAKLQIAQQRMEYVKRRVAEDDGDEELALKPSLKKKFKP